MGKYNFTALITAAASAGAAAAKVATEVAKLCKGKRKAQCEDMKTEAYAAFLDGRKSRDLPANDKRTYEAMRQGFSRYFREKGWGKSGGSSSKSDSAGAKPAEVNHAGMMQWIDAGIESVEEAEAADFPVDTAIKLLKDFRAQFNTLKPSK
jgi:hypothetical protein